MNPTLSAYLGVLRRSWRIVVALPLMAIAAAAALLIVTPAKYESTAVLFVSTPRDDPGGFYRGDMYARDRLASYTALVSTPDLAARVNGDLNLGMKPGALAGSVSMAPIPNTVLLLFRATGKTPGLAQRIAAAYVEELRRSVSAVETIPGSIVPRAELVVVQSPTFDTKQSGFPAFLIIGGAGGAALVLSCLAVVVRSLVDGLVRRPEDAAEAARAPVLAIFPASIPWRDAESRAWVGEAARELRIPLDHLAISESQTVLVTSAEEGAGKTGVALALARALADRGSSVAVIDFDSRASRLAESLDLSDGANVRELIDESVASSTDDPSVDELPVAHWHGVAVIPFGPREDNAGASVDAPAIAPLFDRLRHRFEWLIVDTPAMSSASDAPRLARIGDAVLLIAKTGRTSFDGLRAAAEELTEAGGSLAGVVFVEARHNPSRRLRTAASRVPSTS